MTDKFRVIHRSLLYEAIVERWSGLLEEILEALKATESTHVEDYSEDLVERSREVDNVEAPPDNNGGNNHIQEQPKHDSEEEDQNQNLHNPCISKGSKMLKWIRRKYENLWRRQEKLLDQPNSDGKTAMHIATSNNDGEATRMLLEGGADTNVQQSRA